MKFEKVALYPTIVNCGFVEDFNEKDYTLIQDAIENRLRNKDQMETIHSDPGYTDEGLFLITEGPFPKLKEMFENIALEMHEELYPALKGKFTVLDSMCRGVAFRQTTHDTVHCNVPWHYSAIFIAKSPAGLKHPEGSITFLDPRPYSAEVDLYQLEPKKGLLVVFPSWQRHVVNAIKSMDEVVMMLHMHVMFIHDVNLKEKVKYIGAGYKANPDDVDIVNIADSDSDEGEVDIGRF